MSIVSRMNNQSLIGIKGCSRLPPLSHVGVLSSFHQALDSTAGFHTTPAASQVIVPTTRILNAARPTSPFMLFAKENLAKVKQENPKAASTAIMKTVGQRWASAPKQNYAMKYQALKKEHQQKVAHANALRKKLEPYLHKPANAYTLFAKEKIKTVSGKGAEKQKKLGSEWNHLSKEQKNKYVNEAKNQEKIFADKLGKLSAEESNALKELAFERRVNRLKRIGKSNRRKTLRELAAKYNRPKPALSGWTGFVKQNWATLPKGTGVQKIKAAHAKWKALPVADRQKYLEKGRALLAQHKKDLAAWEAKMVAAGHKDMVRQFHSLKWKPYLPAGVRVIPHKKHVISPEARMKRLEKKRAGLAKKRELKRLRKQNLMQKRKKLAAAKKLRLQKQKAQLKKMQAKKRERALKLKKQQKMKGKKASKTQKKVAKKAVVHKKKATAKVAKATAKVASKAKKAKPAKHVAGKKKAAKITKKH